MATCVHEVPAEAEFCPECGAPAQVVELQAKPFSADAGWAGLSKLNVRRAWAVGAFVVIGAIVVATRCGGERAARFPFDTLEEEADVMRERSDDLEYALRRKIAELEACEGSLSSCKSDCDD